MAKEIINLNSWTEVAPAPIMYPRKKPSNSPRLEPIAEEGADEYDDDSESGLFSFQLLLSWILKELLALQFWLPVFRYI